MNMKRKQDVVIRAPRLDGDNIPSIATTMKQFDHISNVLNEWASKGCEALYELQSFQLCGNPFCSSDCRDSIQFWSLASYALIKKNKNISIILTDNDENHAEELGARSQQGAKNQGILRWAEHITMDILPTRFLHCIFLLVTKREKKHWTSCKRYEKGKQPIRMQHLTMSSSLL